VNDNERSLVTEQQVTACVFSSIYAFHLIVGGLMVCFLLSLLYDLLFCRYEALKSPTLFSKFRWRCDCEHGYQMLFTT